jgi:hypothetical protein
MAGLGGLGMRVLRIGAIVACAVLGILLILLAQDVHSWASTQHRDTLATTAHPSTPVALTASTILPAGVSESALTAGRERDWLDAIQKFAYAYEKTASVDGLGPPLIALLNQGEVALNKLTQDPNPARASQAYDLLAVLVFRQAYPGSNVNPGLVGNALIDLENAVRLDPQNEFAKENLERALRVAVAVHTTVKQAPSTGNAAGTKRKGGQGAPPGVGY